MGGDYETRQNVERCLLGILVCRMGLTKLFLATTRAIKQGYVYFSITTLIFKSKRSSLTTKDALLSATLKPMKPVSPWLICMLPTPSVAVHPWNLSVSKGTGLRTLFCFISLNHLSGGSQWQNRLPKTLTIHTFYSFFILVGIYIFYFGLSLSGGLGTPHHGDWPSVLLSPCCGLAFSGKH